MVYVKKNWTITQRFPRLQPNHSRGRLMTRWVEKSLALGEAEFCLYTLEKRFGLLNLHEVSSHNIF